MPIDMTEGLLTILVLLTAADNWRLRQRARDRRKAKAAEHPVHVLEGDVVMPVPDDPRWVAAEELVGLEEWDDDVERWRKRRRKIQGYKLGDVWVSLDGHVFVGEHETGSSKRTRAYARAVHAAYIQSRALKAVEGE